MTLQMGTLRQPPCILPVAAPQCPWSARALSLRPHPRSPPFRAT
eukprot:CAMPEP_0175600066 /NCGR_PEP_ID=MMETSP0096-20121207/57391_1 /TAXON_ID=311494 /ORGANISM="Alexandrium monilatum, Strain CCMP3105" /LENGTH=43 /DNA_ID= /DNA_START= /DNA_END= /DNA_ORIENTATION=